MRRLPSAATGAPTSPCSRRRRADADAQCADHHAARASNCLSGAASWRCESICVDVAQRGCEWDCDYSLDFDEVLRRHALAASTKRVDGDESEENDDVHASLVTQSVTQRRKVALADVEATAAATGDATAAAATSNGLMLSTLASGALMNLTSSVAVTRFEQRGFRGLEPRVGDDAPAVVQQGRRGIAIGYDDEPAVPKREDQKTS